MSLPVADLLTQNGCIEYPARLRMFANYMRVLTAIYTPVYRWHAVAEQLRAFDRRWYKDQYQNRPKFEQEEIARFHDKYERLVSWGYDLQERALNSLVNPAAGSRDRFWCATSTNNCEKEVVVE